MKNNKWVRTHFSRHDLHEFRDAYSVGIFQSRKSFHPRILVGQVTPFEVGTSIPISSTQTFTQDEFSNHLCNNQELRELREPHNMFKQLGRFREVVGTTNELERIIVIPELSLRPDLVTVRLAQYLCGVNSKLCVLCPRTFLHVGLNERPMPSVVPGIV